MENLNNLKKILVLYIFWFLIISLIWLIGEYFLYGSFFYFSVLILNSQLPAAFVYALFLAVAFAAAQFILSPRPIKQKTEQTTQEVERREPELFSNKVEQEPQIQKIVSQKESRKSKPKKKLKKKKK